MHSIWFNCKENFLIFSHFICFFLSVNYNEYFTTKFCTCHDSWLGNWITTNHFYGARLLLTWALGHHQSQYWQDIDFGCLEYSPISRRRVNSMCFVILKKKPINPFPYLVWILDKDLFYHRKFDLSCSLIRTYLACSISWLLMAWWCKEPGNQQIWY